MGQLPRPEVDAGPHRDLVDALHDLHHRRGWPSLRALASAAACSHTTVSKTFSSPALPTWGTLELLVEAMDGDVDRFRELWLAATTPCRTDHRHDIVGRTAEVEAVVRHLASGSRLLLVTGESGIGKTTLVDAAVARSDVFVARAAGLLPLREEPFFVVSELLRRVHEHDGGQWFKEALAECAAFVTPAVGRLLPELEVEPDPDDRYALGRLHAAVRAVTLALARLRPLALAIEDLHWVDESSMAHLEQQSGFMLSLPVVATQRTDADLSPAHRDQLARLRRGAVATVELGPLTESETGQQLRLLRSREPSSHEVSRVHALTRGNPLLTAQIAGATDASPLPQVIDDYFRGHVGEVDPRGRQVIDVLAVADRPVDVDVLAGVIGIDEDAALDTLRGLDHRHLLRSDSLRIGLAHPLLAEACRRDLLPTHARRLHQGLARALARSADPAAAEVAGHAHRAGDLRMELLWRVRAAVAADARLAFREEVTHWLRVGELWGLVDEPETAAGVPWAQALLGTVRALFAAGNVDEAVPLARQLIDLAPTLAPDLRALVWRRASQVLNSVDPQAAAHLAALALREYEALGDDRGIIGALGDRSCALRASGRNADAARVVEETLARSRLLDDPLLVREALIENAWLAAASGDETTGLALAAEAASMPVPDAPMSAIWLAAYHTDLLLIRGRGPEAVMSAAAPGLDVVSSARERHDQHLETGLRHWILATILVCNVTEAHLDAGDVEAAWEIIEPETREPLQPATRFLHLTRAFVEVARGELDAAAARVDALELLEWGAAEHRLALARAMAAVALATGRPATAFEALSGALAGRDADTSTPTDCLGLVLAARAAADLHDRSAAMRVGQMMRDLGLDHDHPTADVRHVADQAAWAQVSAELARATGSDEPAQWGRAAEGWEALRRPHDAGYCRWRAAQGALRLGQGTAAARLLARARADARGHVPLTEAIADTASGVAG